MDRRRPDDATVTGRDDSRPGDQAAWARLRLEVQHASRLGASSVDFVQRENAAERLFALLLQRAGLSAPAAFDARESQVAYFRSMFRFLETLPSLLAADPNLEVVLEAIRKDGSLQAYYARDPAARRTVQRLIEAGYDADYLVFGRQEILSKAPSQPPSAGRRGLVDDLWGTPEPRRLRAVRSKQQVPEILFDDRRFASCLFKPSGLFHRELSRLLLDPATPMMELWLDPYPELLGLATLYPGLNARGERAILVDSVDYDDRLLELLGKEATLRFVLEALVVDAHLAGADKLLIFAAPHGKALHFVEHVRALAPAQASIVLRELYPFASVDPDDGGLAGSRSGKHHTTSALGHDAPLRGVIDHGYNRVSRKGVEKDLEAGQGVFEIDVRAFLRDDDLTARIPEKEAGVAHEADTVVHRRPDFHAEEIARREEEAFARGAAAIHAAAPQLTVEKCLPSEELLPELLKVELVAYPEGFRYDAGYFRRRFVQQNAELLLLRHEGALVGFALTYGSLLRPPDELYLDNIAILPAYQRKGLGSAVLKTISGLATVRGRSRIHALVEPEAQSQRLLRFYERGGFHSLGDFRGLGTHVEKILGITGPDNREAVDAIVAEATRRLSSRIEGVQITFHTTLDPQLLRTIQDLEAGFPERLRYTAAQFRQRMAYRDAYLLLVRVRGEAVGFANSFHEPTTPAHVINLDAMSVRPDFQRHGIARELMHIMLGLPVLAGYTATLSYCEARSPDGADLVEYYERFGLRAVDFNEVRYRLLSSLRGPAMDCFKAYSRREA